MLPADELGGQHRQHISRAGQTGSRKAAERLDALPASVHDDVADRKRAYELARRYDNHPVYDMVYFALAERLGTSFVTADEKLRKRLVGLDWIVAPEDG